MKWILTGFGAARVERERRLRQRCIGRSVDDLEQIIVDYAGLEAERMKHEFLIAKIGGFSGLFRAG